MNPTRARTAAAALTIALAATVLAVVATFVPFSPAQGAPTVADSIPVTVPDVGVAPAFGPALADSIPVVVPDVGAAPVPSFFVADSIPVIVPDVG